MKKPVILIFAASILAGTPSRSFAWGAIGHQIVAKIAFAYVDSTTRQNVQNCLGDMTIEQAAVWMDEIKKDPKYDYMKPWHYVDFEKGMQYTPTTEGNI